MTISFEFRLARAFLICGRAFRPARAGPAELKRCLAPIPRGRTSGSPDEVNAILDFAVYRNPPRYLLELVLIGLACAALLPGLGRTYSDHLVLLTDDVGS